MRIEKKFYDLAKAQWDEIEEEVHHEKERQTEAEREIEKLKSQEELQKIYQKGEEHARRWKRVPDARRIQLFQKITGQALWMAEYIGSNIIVEEKENSFGKIILESGGFVLPSFEDRGISKVFSNLFLAADDTCVDLSSAGLCKMEFCFRLYQEIPADETE